MSKEKVKFKEVKSEAKPESGDLATEMNNLNKNLRAFHRDHYKSLQFLHKDLRLTNDYLYWISLSFKISVICGLLIGLIIIWAYIS
tara:strand:+ start:521 stop:778 length:258 start_codon:yes stop_codon:yes gene_type:complete